MAGPGEEPAGMGPTCSPLAVKLVALDVWSPEPQHRHHSELVRNADSQALPQNQGPQPSGPAHSHLQLVSLQFTGDGSLNSCSSKRGL